MKKFLIILLVVIESCSLFLLYKSSTSKRKVDDNLPLQDVVYKEQNTEFVYLLEQNLNQEDYLEIKEIGWPSDRYQFNINKSYCLDLEDKQIKDALIYNANDDILILDTDIAKVCYLYFKMNY